MKALIYCDSQEKFDETYNNLRSIAASEMMQTFDKNWLKCQEAWSLKDKILVLNLKNNSTNRVERHNRLLKTVFNVNTALYEAVEGIVNIILANKKDDRLYKMHEALTKRTDINSCSDPIVEVICNDLTDYASKIVCEQLLLSRKPAPFPFLYKQTDTSCTCTLFKYFKLPCRHIMRYLRQQDLPVYSKEHVPQRWWKEYNFVNDAANPIQAYVVPTQQKAQNQLIQAKLPGEALYDVLKPAEMYKKLIPLLPKLKTAALSSGTRIFYLRYQVLVDLLEAWNSGTEVAIVHVSPAQVEDINLQSLEVVTEQPSKERGISQTANFHLNKVVVKGKPSGMGETIHDGTKKTGTPRKRKILRKAVGKKCCCVCGNEAGSHCCQVCGETVHSIPPCSIPAPGVEEGYGMLCICKHCQDVSKSSEDDDCHEINSENLSQVPSAESNIRGHDPDNLIENSDSPPTNEWPDFRLAVVRTKGRQKNKAKGPAKWNFTSLADHAPTCCICDKEVEIDHKCSRDYICFGCGKVLSLRLVKSGKFAGRPFYGCDKGTAKCDYFKFWKPLQKEKGKDVTKPQEHPLQTSTASAFESDEDDRILSDFAFAVEDELGIPMSAGLQSPSNTPGSAVKDKEVVIDLTATTDDDSDYDHCEQSIKNEMSTDYTDSAEGIISRCKVCFLAFPNRDHRCCMKCKQQITTNSHNCICMVCHQPIEKRALECFRCTRPVHAKCSSLQKENDKDGIIVQMCDNCKLSRDTGLLPSALNDITTGKSLTDEHLNAACNMIKAAFNDLGGLTAPQNIVRFEGQFKVAPHVAKSNEDYLQMLNTGTGHWVLLIVSQGQPFLMDSFYRNKITAYVKTQIREIMSLDEDIIVSVPHIQEQDNATDCALYVIANAVDFAISRKVRKVTFIREELRPHWLKCINERIISEFPHEQLEDVTIKFSSHVIHPTPNMDPDIVNGQCRNCMMEDPQPGHTCCKLCKVQNKRRGHICQCVVCLDPTSDNANLIPLLCNGCGKPIHDFCSKFIIEESTNYCFCCKIKRDVNLERETVREILDGRLISKEHLNVASTFLRNQYPDLGGLAEPKDVERKKEYLLFTYDNIKDEQDYLQFLNTGTGHWVLLVVKEGVPYLFGSNVKATLTSELETQVAAIVSCFQSEFVIYMPDIFKEDDSGLLAIAYAVEFAEKRDIHHDISFEGLHSHWLKCLLEGKISVFPNLDKVPVCMNETTTKVYCVCRLPEHYSSTMTACDLCGEWYHPACVNRPDSQKWNCPLCTPST